MSLVIIAVVAAIVVGALAGRLSTRRAGRIREVPEASLATAADVEALGISRGGPTVVHFSAPWCGPCDRVRRVVGQVCDDLGAVAHIEVDLDTNPVAARRFSVLSLPTTLIFDVEGRQRYRASGVPTAADLRSALQPLLA
ncbi:TlpA family protein disulfide reductase [Mycobacterium parmense]|uniref:Thiol reductase thioredoxin n=1 Tax=Mycobacterium parmense TaxID=185642 RepID=A0A7I7YZJ6_9MYCO|nr:thioredoxin family protein [Mycobacterium parmense]MCV7350137.1 thioredoxin family protein [Mycobacterium parmense]ORW59855.1 thioredoxin [Mycobacterium parmense]BBZ47335.1 thiol reductase thioredoxin [Mycobacterium parmense]